MNKKTAKTICRLGSEIESLHCVRAEQAEELHRLRCENDSLRERIVILCEMLMDCHGDCEKPLLREAAET